MKHLCLAILCCTLALGAVAENDLLRKASPHSVTTTVERFEAAVRAKGLKVFPRIDHGVAADEFAQTMRPAVVVAFGNPKYGTPFMVQNPEAGIDFPPRAIVYEDANGQVWLTYNSATYLYEGLFRRHGLDYPESDVGFFRDALESLTDSPVGTEPITD